MGRYELAEEEHRRNVASVEASGWAAPETWMRFVFAAALLGRESHQEATSSVGDWEPSRENRAEQDCGVTGGVSPVLRWAD